MWMPTREIRAPEKRNRALRKPPLRSDKRGMSITIRRDDVDYGPYSIEQITELLAQRRITTSDLALAEGRTNWTPLENLIIQDSFRKQREAYVAKLKNPGVKKNPPKPRDPRRRW
jgi:hypothetical protein